jgi:predicted MFS family arabinose efflux permease
LLDHRVYSTMMPNRMIIRRPSPLAIQLFVLAAATFVFVTTETQPVALLVPMSRDLGVSESTIGLLMTAYAGLAALTAIPLTIFASRIPRRPLVIATVAMLVASQVTLALAPSYEFALLARLVGALAHGVFWSVIAQVAATLVARDRIGRATAAVFAGNSVALVAGVPLVSAIGSLVGWRAAVACMGVFAALIVAGMWRVLPAMGSGEAHLDRRDILTGAFRLPRLLIVCAVTVFVALGQFVAFTYLAPIVRAHTGLSGTGLAAVLLAYGAAGVVGVAAVGSITDRRPRAALLSCCGAVVGALALISVLGHSTLGIVLGVIAWGAGFTALPICLQSAVLRVAPKIPDTASALYVVAFQIGIGGGALIGAGLLGAGELGSIPTVALALIATGSLIAAAAGSTFARDPAPRSFRRLRRRRPGQRPRGGHVVGNGGHREGSPATQRTRQASDHVPAESRRPARHV